MMTMNKHILSDDEIESIAEPFLEECGGHWEYDIAIREKEVEDFARAIEATILTKLSKT